MKTVHKHELKASNVEAQNSWDRKLTIKAVEIVGEVQHEVQIELDAKQLKDLLRQGRNALIDAKVIRGKKRWS